MVTSLQFQITSAWSVINEIKEKINIAMNGMKPSEVDFAIITASELLENAIKYGVPNETISGISFDFEMDNSMILMYSKNGINPSGNLGDLKKTMQKIKATQDKSTLYLERLQEIMEDPSQPGSHLGLYRIVSESKFDLDYDLSENILQIIATKKI